MVFMARQEAGMVYKKMCKGISPKVKAGDISKDKANLLDIVVVNKLQSQRRQ